MQTKFSQEKYDAIVIGGGFYGCCIAIFLRATHPRVLLLEKESDLLQRASFVNQARVHNGYHYPRSYVTAQRSHLNFPQFVLDFRDCIESRFDKIYAIARSNSKVSAFQFRKTFSNLGAPIKEAPRHIKNLFNPRLVEEIFSVEEFAFDAIRLRGILRQRLREAQIEVRCQSEAERVIPNKTGQLVLNMKNGGDLTATRIINCTYAGMNKLLVASGLPRLPFKYELAELALIEMPDELKNVGITMMDGPFFSAMPFPSRNLHSLTHVRYTPHKSWTYQDSRSDENCDLSAHNVQSNAPFMIKDSQRYLPALKAAKYCDSLFEIKTILLQNENDDGRPILFRPDYGLKNYAVVMGGKIDNIYDIFAKLNDTACPPAVALALAS